MGDYCAGRDTSRRPHSKNNYENSAELGPQANSGEEDNHQKEALKQHAQDRLNEADSFNELEEVVQELVMLQNLLQEEENELPDNGKKKSKKKDKELAKEWPCSDHGASDLCDETICQFDGECRSGCCS